jgi:hypothetical protein
MAQAQLFESIKFQCRICGTRVICGLKYREHLDAHFNEQHSGSSSNPLTAAGIITTNPGGEQTNKRHAYLSFAQFEKSSKEIR